MNGASEKCFGSTIFWLPGRDMKQNIVQFYHYTYDI